MEDGRVRERGGEFRGVVLEEGVSGFLGMGAGLVVGERGWFWGEGYFWGGTEGGFVWKKDEEGFLGKIPLGSFRLCWGDGGGDLMKLNLLVLSNSYY